MIATPSPLELRLPKKTECTIQSPRIVCYASICQFPAGGHLKEATYFRVLLQRGFEKGRAIENRPVRIVLSIVAKVKKLKKQEKKELDDAVLDILNDPSIGGEKVGDLLGVLVHKFKINKRPISLSYTYNESEIHLVAIS